MVSTMSTFTLGKVMPTHKRNGRKFVSLLGLTTRILFFFMWALSMLAKGFSKVVMFYLFSKKMVTTMSNFLPSAKEIKKYYMS